MKRDSFLRALSLLMLTMLAALFGTDHCVAMGVAADGTTGVGSTGTETVTEGEEIGDPEWYEKFIDQEVTKVQPTSTPLLQLISYAKKVSGNSITVKYYTNGYRPYKTSLSAAFSLGADAAEIAASEGLDRWQLTVADKGVFSVDDTILVLGVPGYKPDGTTQDPSKNLMLIVCDIDSTTGKPVFYCANGRLCSENGDNIVPPTSILSGTKLLRMGKAAPELAAQTGTYYSLPRAKENHVQKFMTQVEASTIERIQKKEINNFTWSDQEEDAIADMKRTMEFSYMWGVKSAHNYGTKGKTWTCDGVWYMASKQLAVGSVVSGVDVITNKDMVDVLKDLYAGTSLGGKQKVWLCGSDFLASLSKMEAENTRVVYRETVEKYGLKFKSFDSEFGEILAVHSEVMNAAGMSKWAFSIDPDFLRKYTFRSFARNVIDKNAIGVSETEAAVLREMSCCYLKYGPAHARLYLASVSATPTDIETVTKASANIDKDDLS